MENMDRESEVRNDFHFGCMAGDGQAVRRVMNTVETVATTDPNILIRDENGARKEELYKAVIALSRKIAGRTDLRSLVSGVAESLRQILIFDHIAVILHDPNENAMHGYIFNEPCNPVIT